MGKKASKVFIHRLADVATSEIGEGSFIWQFVVVLSGAKIGADCNICSHVLIESDVIIGDRVTVKCGVQIWDGLRVGDDVFIGPNVTFANDKYPKSKKRPDKYIQTILESGSSIGAGAVILPGITIGRESLVGAGAIVTKSVPPHSIVVGNPARVISYTAKVNENLPAIAQLPPSSNLDCRVTLESTVRGVMLYELPFVMDNRGKLSVGEFENTLPFVPKRYFLVYDVPATETRGEHAHHKCKQFMICVKGSCSVVADDSINRQEFLLNRPNIGLFMPEMTWGIQYRYSMDATLLVFASENYDKSDYIQDYDKFLRSTGKVR